MGFQKGNKSWTGKTHSQETRAKISNKRKSQTPPMQGRVHSQETKQKMSTVATGRKHPYMDGVNNINWKGGVDSKTRVKYAPRPKPEQCEICGSFGVDFKKGLCLDHDHATGKFRGWLCTRCNAALGMVKDNSETLMAMINYLIKSREL